MIDTATVTHRYPVGDSPASLTLSPDGTTLYVVESSDQRIAIIDTGSDTIQGRVPVASTHTSVALSQDGHALYIADEAANAIRAVDAETQQTTTLAEIRVPHGIAVTPR